MSDPLSTSSGAQSQPEPDKARAGRRRAIARRMRRARSGDSLLITILLAFVIAMGVRVLLFQPFHIPSESMRPALEAGDYVVAAKWPYGYSRYSIPFAPDLFEGRIGGSLPQRGDVIFFRAPHNGGQIYTKRLIGLPGDRVEVRGGALFINGEAVPRGLIGEESRTNPAGGLRRYRLYEEILPGGIGYEVLDRGQGDLDDFGPVRVPDGHLFALGDNRDESRDSRVAPPLGPGFIPVENLVGRGEMVLLSASPELKLWRPWTWWRLRGDRFFVSLDPDPS
jgi:signal peptidase I